MEHCNWFRKEHHDGMPVQSGVGGQPADAECSLGCGERIQNCVRITTRERCPFRVEGFFCTQISNYNIVQDH